MFCSIHIKFNIASVTRFFFRHPEYVTIAVLNFLLIHHVMISHYFVDTKIATAGEQHSEAKKKKENFPAKETLINLKFANPAEERKICLKCLSRYIILTK